MTLSPEGEPGAVLDLVFGIDLSSLGGNDGDFFAGVLRFRDMDILSDIWVPIRTVKSSTHGLWVGEARVNEVMSSTSVNEIPEFGPTSTAAPLRLILHHSATGESKLLQRVYFGYDTNFDPLLTTQESLLDPEHLNISRRISAVHLPWSEENLPFDFDGNFGGGEQLTTNITTKFDDHRSNPFLHSYHPDHDNKNASFDQEQPRGEESYGISRDITLKFGVGEANDFEAATQFGNLELEGVYEETIWILGKTGLSADDSVPPVETLQPEKKGFSVRGTFKLKHLTLDTPLAFETLQQNP